MHYSNIQASLQYECCTHNTRWLIHSKNSYVKIEDGDQTKLPYLTLILLYLGHILLRDSSRPGQVVRSEHFQDMLRGLNPKETIPGALKNAKEMREVQEDLTVDLEALFDGQHMVIITNA